MPHTGLETLHVPICIPRVVTWECVWVPRQDAHGRRGTADGDRGFLFPRPRLSTQTGQLAALTGPCEAAAGAILPLSRLQKLRQPKAMGTSLRPTARQWKNPTEFIPRPPVPKLTDKRVFFPLPCSEPAGRLTTRPPVRGGDCRDRRQLGPVGRVAMTASPQGLRILCKF